MTDQECAAVFHEMLDRLTFEGESLPVKAAIERAIELLEREAQWVDDEGAAIAVERAHVLGASKIHRPLKDKYQTWPKDES